MKKIILFVLVCSSLAAQTGKVAQKIDGLRKENKVFVSHALFALNQGYSNTDYSKSVDNATIVSLDLNQVNKIVEKKDDYLELQVPYNGEILSLLLYKVAIQADGYQVDTDQAKNITVEKGVHYRGVIKGDQKSLVSFNLFHNQVSGILSGSKYQNIVIGRLNTQGNLKDYIIYSDAKLKTKNSFTCTTPDQYTVKTTENLNRSVLTQKCVTIYFEIDYDMYVANGSDVNQTNIWMNSVFNNVQTLYSNDGINIAIKSIYVWTTPDSYSGQFSWQYLDQFHQQRPVFNGDVGQLIGIDSGLGGVADVIDGLCSQNNYSYSDVFFEFDAVPTFSWSVQVIAHELGHLLGSPHTHGCYWNGDGTAIDGCGPTANLIYSEGNCLIADLPAEGMGGTIMSYCHLLGEIGINFANGFGPQPAARIIQTVDGSNCLGTDCINTCISQVYNVNTFNITQTSAGISWTDQNLENTSWEVSVVPYPYTPVWTTVSTNPYIAAELAPNTTYTVCVRSSCPSGIESISKCDYLFTTADFCAGASFVDTGGPGSNYSDNEYWFRTVAPVNPADKIKVVFNSIDIEYDYDYLFIYDGPNNTYPELTGGGLTGSVIPNPFEATTESGALTFQFISDTNTTGAGWDATFSCLNLGTTENGYVDFSYYPNPVKNNVSIKSKNEIQGITIYSIDGKLLYENKAKQFDTTVDLSAYASGTYIFRLQFENKPVTFKVVRE